MITRRDVVRLALALPLLGFAGAAAGGFAPNRSITGTLIIRITNGEKEALSVSLTDAVLANDSIAVR